MFEYEEIKFVCENLIKVLRYCATVGDCSNCPGGFGKQDIDSGCCPGATGENGLYIQAANAIEELQTVVESLRNVPESPAQTRTDNEE